MIRNRRRRGALTYGMAAVIVVLAAMTAMVLLRSSEIYHEGAKAKWHTQALAAAEGAAVAVEAAGLAPLEQLEIGHATVTTKPAEEKSNDQRRVLLEVDVLGKSGRVLLTRQYTAHFIPDAKEEGSWTLAGLSAK